MTPPGTRPARRGFTLIEVVLASVIGSIVLFGAVAIFYTLAAADRVMQSKFESMHDAAITHGALRRSMTRLVLANEDARSLTEAEAAEAALGQGDDAGAQDQTPGPAQDPGGAQNQAPGPSGTSGGSSGPGAGRGQAGAGTSGGSGAAPPGGTPTGSSAATDDQAAGGNGPDAEEVAEAAESGDEAELARLLSDLDEISRPRLMLETDWSPTLARMVQLARIDGVELFDPSLGLGYPQRLEVVLTEPPLPEGFEVGRPSWMPARTRQVVEGYASFDNASASREGGVRGVFELRPDGARELVLAGYGVNSRTRLRAEKIEIPPEARDPEGWTLWWRPITNREYVLREAGRLFDADTSPELLQGAIPLLRGITVARWNIIADRRVPDSDRRVLHRYNEYQALSERDVPGYVELELETADGMYHSWAFEVGWIVDDVFEPDEEVLASVGQALAAAGESLPPADKIGRAHV